MSWETCRMTKESEIQQIHALSSFHQDALNASGLVDNVVDVAALAPQPSRFAEGEFICNHGDQVDCLWVIANGSVAVKGGETTFFVRRRNEVVGEQHTVGNGYRRMYDLVAAESSVEVLSIDRSKIEAHPEANVIWQNIARIISIKLRNNYEKIDSIQH